MAKCVYFFDKVTGKIIGMNSHAEKDLEHPGKIKEADADITDVWEEIRTGKMWPFILDKVTDRDPDNIDYIYAENIPTGYNNFKPSYFGRSEQLERRPYFCLKVKTNPRLKKEEEHGRRRVYDVDTEGDITLDMEISVRTTQNTIEDHKKDKEVTNISGEFLAECTYGTLVPRDGVISMQNGKVQFQWILPDTTMKEPARCYVKDPKGGVLISKSLRVKCC